MSKKDNYKSLKHVLLLALQRASEGKGKERHANDLPFEQQTISEINRMTNCGFSYGQIFKKLKEIPNLKTNEAKINEMLDIIVYASGYVLIMNEKGDEK